MSEELTTLDIKEMIASLERSTSNNRQRIKDLIGRVDGLEDALRNHTEVSVKEIDLLTKRVTKMEKSASASETDVPAPCPFCGTNEVHIVPNKGGIWWVACANIACRAVGPTNSSAPKAVNDWNRVAKKD